MMKDKKSIIVIVSLIVAILLIVVFGKNGASAADWRSAKVISSDNSGGAFNERISSDYSFALKVNKNTKLEIPSGFSSQNCINGASVVSAYISRINENKPPITCKLASSQNLSDSNMSSFLSSNGGTWALYRNVGEYQGKTVSVQMIARNANQPAYFRNALSNNTADNGKNPVIAFYIPNNGISKQNIGIYMTYIKHIDVQFNFYYDEDIKTDSNGHAVVNNSGEVQLESGKSKAKIKGYFTLLDVDMGQSIVFNDAAYGSSNRGLDSFANIYTYAPAMENNAVINTLKSRNGKPYACVGSLFNGTQSASQIFSETLKCPHIVADPNTPGGFYASEAEAEQLDSDGYSGMVSVTFGKPAGGTDNFYVDFFSARYKDSELLSLNEMLNGKTTLEEAQSNVSTSNFTSGFWFGTDILGYFELTPPIKRVNNKISHETKVGETFTYKINQIVPWVGSLKYSTFVITDNLNSNTEAPSAGSVTIKDEEGSIKTSLFDITVNGQVLKISAKFTALASDSFYDHTYTITFVSKVKDNSAVNQELVNNNGSYSLTNKVTTTVKRNDADNESASSNDVTVKVTKPVTVKYHLVGDKPVGSPDVPADQTLKVGDSYTAKAKLADGIYANKKCTFTGWTKNNDASGNAYTSEILTDDLDLYGKWICYDPVVVEYHVLGDVIPPIDLTTYSNGGAAELNNRGEPSETGTFYVNDTYTSKSTLKTSWKNQKCEFTGWTKNNDASGSAYTSARLTGNLDLYGKWNCENLILDPTKEVNKSEVLGEEEFEYTITHTVPAIDDSYFYYSKYVLTDNLEHLFTVGRIGIFSDGVDVKNKFNINIIGNKVVFKPVNLSDPDFYGKTYQFKIVASINSNYYSEVENYPNYDIPNKAVLEVNDVVKETGVNIKPKKVNIRYHVIGDLMPDPEKTSPKPADEQRYSGTKYIQAGPLTTTERDRVCTFNGWYTDESMTKKWADNNYLMKDLDFYGKWECDNVVKEINKTTFDDKIVGTKEFDYVIYQNVPDLTEDYYYKSYTITDELEAPLKIDDESKVLILSGTDDVTNRFNISIDGNKITIEAKDTSKAEFYNNNYEFILTVHKRKDADLTPYKDGNKYVIPNKAKLNVELSDNSTVEQETPEVLKEIKEVKINYEVIGEIKPDPSLTDPTPEGTTILSGELYSAENPLTTRYSAKQCMFSGWYSDNTLKTIYNDSELNDDLTLYGVWDCKDIVVVPPTDSSISNIVLTLGSLLSIGAVVGVYCMTKKNNIKKE